MKLTKTHIKLIAAFVFICILGIAFLTLKVINENEKCVANPFIYGAEKIKNGGINVFCRCDPLNPKYAGFTYDENGIYINQPEQLTPFNINFTFP